ncbi:hypothetical protein bmyco0003_22060 [Bacillus pseudomycoides]|jgi:hypothetical protein|nr:hypothetical protein bmyco0002_52010 [Bacillus pseudomycoides]EEM11032.1 hypothetical protein bmyco0003_22060 [Bacillus pseudomycoides]EEM16849.1 hypothetical protein bpmyx0001_22620 [Bacillus pseudomycoides DSM 12442]
MLKNEVTVMKNEILKLVPEAVKKLIQKDVKERNKRIIDLIIDDATAYEFEPDQVVPCIMAAYYAYESTPYPSEMEDEWMKILVFHTATRSAMKLLSYGKFKAKRSESGWMKYTGH